MKLPVPDASPVPGSVPAQTPSAAGMTVTAEERERVREESAVSVELEPAAPAPAAAPAAYREKRRPVQLAMTFLQLGGMGVLAYFCLFNFSIVRGSSMAPRIHDGDRILIDHVSYMFDPVERGDIVVLKYPLDPSVDYIKRVIGLPGDEVVMEGGQVWVNGEEILEPYVADPDPLTRMTVHVKAAHYFVLGDNRQRSCDSREFGLVPQDYVRGKVEVRVWPPARIGKIDA